MFTVFFTDKFAYEQKKTDYTFAGMRVLKRVTFFLLYFIIFWVPKKWVSLTGKLS